MLERSKKTNLLEQRSYKYDLHDVETPNLYTEIYDYAEIPKVPFNHRRVPLGMADEIFITDTSFRDGQQSRTPYSVDEIADLFKLLSRLGGETASYARRNFSRTANGIGRRSKNVSPSDSTIPRSPRGFGRKKRTFPSSKASASRKRVSSSAVRIITFSISLD